VWNPRAEWVVSAELTHPALVSDQDFLTVQQITAVALPKNGRARRYALAGLLICDPGSRRSSFAMHRFAHGDRIPGADLYRATV